MMRSLPGLVILALLTVPSLASAYVPSPRYGMFEIKFGPYVPDVDNHPDLGGDTPYAGMFGGSEPMFLTTLELDWQFARVPGVSFGLGGSMGFMQECAASKTESGDESADATCLNVMPFAILGVIRVDALPDYLKIPIVPYFKGGMNWFAWWTLNAGNKELSGGTMGWQINPGVAIQLDGFDQMSARTFDNEIGVNHSYLFFELFIGRVKGVDEHAMNLSPKEKTFTFQIGLALEF